VTEGRKTYDVIIATAGESSPSKIFCEWYGSGKEPPQKLFDLGGDFTCLVLTPFGLLEGDVYCCPEPVLDYSRVGFYAVGSGAKAALAAMHCGKSAIEAVRIAARIDPYTGGHVVHMKLPDQPAKRKKKRKTKSVATK
jgi:hypothetical protein